MDKIKVLVLGVGGNVSQGIIKALKNTDLDIELIGACISPESIGLYMCDKAFIAPYADDEKFIDWLILLCNQESIDIVLTGVEENICAIQKQINKFQTGTNAVFVASDYDKLMIGQDKFLTCEWLKENGCNYPKYCKMEDTDAVEKIVKEAGFPLVAKPRMGKSSQGVFLLHSREELEQVKADNYVLEECIGTENEEYTVGCYCDKNGELIDIIIMHRKLKDGSTAWAEVVEHSVIRKEAEKICKAFAPKGPLNIQLRMDDNGKPVCFELNVRFSGTTPMRSHFGYHDVEAMIREYVLQESIEECFQVRFGEAFRYVNELYMDSGAIQAVKQKGFEIEMKKYHTQIDEMRQG